MVTVGKNLTAECLHPLTFFFLLPLHDISLYKTQLFTTHLPFPIFIAFGLTVCMQSLVTTKLSFSMHPKENHGNSLIGKIIPPSTEGNTCGWSGNCTCLDCQSVLERVSEWSSKFLIVLLQSCSDWLENNKVKSNVLSSCVVLY